MLASVSWDWLTAFLCSVKVSDDTAVNCHRPFWLLSIAQLNDWRSMFLALHQWWSISDQLMQKTGTHRETTTCVCLWWFHCFCVKQHTTRDPDWSHSDDTNNRRVVSSWRPRSRRSSGGRVRTGCTGGAVKHMMRVKCSCDEWRVLLWTDLLSVLMETTWACRVSDTVRRQSLAVNVLDVTRCRQWSWTGLYQWTVSRNLKTPNMLFFWCPAGLQWRL